MSLMVNVCHQLVGYPEWWPLVFNDSGAPLAFLACDAQPVSSGQFPGDERHVTSGVQAMSFGQELG